MSWRKGQAYGQDLRDRVLQAPGRLREVALRFGVSASYVLRVRARREQLGQSVAGAQCNHMLLRLGALKNEVLAQVASAPHQTLVQLCEWARTSHGIVVKPSTMHKRLVRFGLTFKKNDIRQRAATPRHRAVPHQMDRRAAVDGRTATDLSGRNFGHNQHDAAPGSGTARPALPRVHARRALENHHSGLRPGRPGSAGTAGARWAS